MTNIYALKNLFLIAARKTRFCPSDTEKHRKLQTMRLEFFYSHPDGDENQEPTVYPSFAFGKKTA